MGFLIPSSAYDCRVIPGVIECRPDIVAHAAIYGDISPYTRNFFYSDNAIQGESRLSDDPAPWFND